GGCGAPVLGHQLGPTVLGGQVVDQHRQQRGPFRGGGELLVAPAGAGGDDRQRAVGPLPIELVEQPFVQHGPHIEAGDQGGQRGQRVPCPSVLLVHRGVGGHVVHVVAQ